MYRLLFIVSALWGSYAFSDSEQVYNTGNFSPAKGYLIQVHNVVTSDGYILEVHRISHDKTPGPPVLKPVVFLMHGLLAGSNCFTYLGPEYGIAYNLVDAGFDVWMGNARGNRFSRNHISLNPDEDKLRFFDFSFEDIALEDLPAMIDYVLRQTKQAKLHYIGHSQGGTVFLVLNSMRTKYHGKIASAHLLAGVGYQNNFPNLALRLLAQNTDLIYNTMRLAGSVELFPPDSDGIFGRTTSRSSLSNLSRTLGVDVSSELMAGAALKQVAHYGQNIRDRNFRRWNFGILNLSIYGRINPPSYDLSKINIDVTLHYSLNDTLLSETDTLSMVNALPNAKARKIARDSFTHLDYISSKDVKVLLTDYIIESLKKS